jgi:parallel beta-helix repeat protein
MEKHLITKGLVCAVIFLFIGISSQLVFADYNVEKSPMTVSSDNTLYVGGSGEGNYSKIQDAIDNASDGDTVFVYDDSSPYFEHVVINKSINLFGENKDTTIIDGSGIGDVVYVVVDWVNITRFTIQNSGPHDIGVRTDSNFNFFSYNNIVNNIIGLSLDGSISNMVIDNNVSYNNVGIYMWGCNNNMITDNTFNLNGFNGIHMGDSHSNMIIGNNASNNDNNGIYLAASSTNNMIIGNYVSNNENGFYLEGESDYDTINDNIVSNNDNIGIYLAPYSNDIMVIGNNVSNNDHGILIWWGTYNNLLYHNNLFNNSVDNAWDSSENNIWFNSTLQEGNYYDDYIGIDEDDDGIGDIPYNIPGNDNEDIYPLMVPWGSVKADANGPYYGLINESIQFNGTSSGGYYPHSYHWDFGDNYTSEEQNPIHTYTTSGNYTVTFTVTDNTSNSISDTTFAWIQETNTPPNKPTIEGPTKGNVGTPYPYNVSTTDPDNSIIWYFIDWGDGTNTNWIGPYESGTEINQSHSWSEKGTYIVKVKAKDPYNAESLEATLEVTMPRKREIISSLFLRFLERFLFLEKLFLQSK